MDEATVRLQAESHGQATVAGDLKAAGADLDKSAYGAAGEVMKRLPEGLTGSEVSSVQAEGEEWVVAIDYSAPSENVTVESRWAERDGRPKIVDLKAL